MQLFRKEHLCPKAQTRIHLHLEESIPKMGAWIVSESLEDQVAIETGQSSDVEEE